MFSISYCPALIQCPLTNIHFSPSQHVQKLRKNRDTTGISAAAGGATPAVTPSGKNNAFAKTPGTKSGGGRKRPAPKLDFKVEKTESDIDGGIDDDEEFNKMMLKTEPKSDVNDTPSKPKRARTANTYVLKPPVRAPVFIVQMLTCEI